MDFFRANPLKRSESQYMLVEKMQRLQFRLFLLVQAVYLLGSCISALESPAYCVIS